MDFLSTLLAFALPQGFTQTEVTTLHKNYCENLYFQPKAEEKLEKAECDIYTVSTEISRVKSGKY